MGNVPASKRAFREWRQAVITAHRTGTGFHPSWWAKFEAFLSDMGTPAEGQKLRRRNENRPYTPENVYWG